MMKTWTLIDPNKFCSFASVTICKVHEHNMPEASATVGIVTAAPNAVCDVCRQDRIRALIRAQGSVVA